MYKTSLLRKLCLPPTLLTPFSVEHHSSFFHPPNKLARGFVVLCDPFLDNATKHLQCDPELSSSIWEVLL